MEVITILLRREGYNVLRAANGKEALEQVNKNPDLFILDVMLPDLDGVEVCRRIRETSLAPVIFLTAKGGLQEKTDVLVHGIPEVRRCFFGGGDGNIVILVEKRHKKSQTSDVWL